MKISEKQHKEKELLPDVVGFLEGRSRLNKEEGFHIGILKSELVKCNSDNSIQVFGNVLHSEWGYNTIRSAMDDYEIRKLCIFDIDKYNWHVQILSSEIGDIFAQAKKIKEEVKKSLKNAQQGVANKSATPLVQEDMKLIEEKINDYIKRKNTFGPTIV